MVCYTASLKVFDCISLKEARCLCILKVSVGKRSRNRKNKEVNNANDKNESSRASEADQPARTWEPAKAGGSRRPGESAETRESPARDSSEEIDGR